MTARLLRDRRTRSALGSWVDLGVRLRRSPVDPLALALLLGVVASLLRADAAWGLNIFIVVTVFSLIADRIIARVEPESPADRRLGVWLAHLGAAGFLFTESVALRALDVGVIVIGLAIPLVRPRWSALAIVRPLSLAFAILETVSTLAVGGLLLVGSRILPEGGVRDRASRSPECEGAGSGMTTSAGPILGGTLVALVLTLAFGALLRSADAAFDAWVATELEPNWFLGRLAVAFGVAALFGGWLLGVIARPFGDDPPVPAPDPVQLRGATVLIPTVTLVGVFGAFLFVQFGQWFPAAPPDDRALAAIARRGFFQLLAVGGLALATILAADSCLRYAPRRIRQVFGVAAGVLLVEVGAILAGAAWRMALYVERFGWTEARFVATAGLGAVALALPWFAVTALRGRAERFVAGSLGIAVALVVALHVLPLGEMIVASHLERAPGRVASAEEMEIDHDYLASLPVDAIPAIVARWEAIPEPWRPTYRARWQSCLSRQRPAAAVTWPRVRGERSVGRLFADEARSSR